MIPTWFRMPCLYQMMTGLYCPGFGGTRAVRALLSGHPVLSFLYHPVVPYMASVAVWAAASWILYFATGNRRFRPELDDRIAYAAAGSVIGALLAFSFLFSFDPTWWLCLTIVIAGAVGSSRIVLRQHTLSQVGVGVLVGFFWGFISILYV